MRCEKIEKRVRFGMDAGNGFRMRLLHGAQKAVKELYREVQFFRSSAAKKILHKRSAASASECFEAAFFRSGFVQPLSFNCFTDFVFWV